MLELHRVGILDKDSATPLPFSQLPSQPQVSYPMTCHLRLHLCSGNCKIHPIIQLHHSTFTGDSYV